VEEEFVRLIKTVPKMPANDVPVGASEDENVVAKTVGEPTKLDFEPKNHAQIARLKVLDKERAAKSNWCQVRLPKGRFSQTAISIVNFVYQKPKR